MEERDSYEEWPHGAAVIGAGTMGLGVAECFAAAGIRVLLTDATPELTGEAKRQLVQRARGHADAGLLAEGAVTRIEAVETADDVAGAVGDVGLVLEAVPEDLGLKEEILASCSAAAPQDAVIVSNTSSLPIGVRRKARALLRDALVQSARMDARCRGHPGRRDRTRGGRAAGRVSAGNREASRRSR